VTTAGGASTFDKSDDTWGRSISFVFLDRAAPLHELAGNARGEPERADQLASLQKLIDRERAWLSRQPATGAVWPAVDEG